MISEAEVRTALNSIVDPCSAAAGVPAGLQDMGLVRRVHIQPGQVQPGPAQPGQGRAARIKVVLAVTEFGCLMGAPFAQSAYERLIDLNGVEQVEVELDDKFDWHTSDMDPGYRDRLEDFRALQRSRTIPIRLR